MQKSSREMLSDLAWNYFSLIILSLSGFVFNCLIVWFYDSAVLGVFNQTYAWYCVLSQVSALGIHLSVVPYVADHENDKRKLSAILNTGLMLVCVISVGVIVCVEAVLPFLLDHNTMLLRGMQMVMPGVLGFSVNKVMLNYLNGLSKMKAYALFQSLRYVLIVFAILVMALMGKSGEWLSLSFGIAEFLLAVLLICYLSGLGAWHKEFCWEWARKHILFGIQVFPANLVLELNAKVDIICLGLVLRDDTIIGIYSFAALFVEGFYQIFVVIRRSINPKLTVADTEHHLSEFLHDLNRRIRIRYPVFSCLGLLGVSATYLLLCYCLNRKEYFVGIYIILIVASTIVLTGKSIVYGNIFAQVKQPIYESVINVTTVLTNFLFNLLMIYFWGMFGAAVATALSYVVYAMLLNYLTYQKLGINIQE